MSVNGISNQIPNNTANTVAAVSAGETETKTNNQSAALENGAVYESGSYDQTSGIYKKNSDTIAQLKADAERRYEQLQDLVRALLSKQGQALQDSESIWEKLRTGQVNVDPKTAAKAAEEVSENGYWGVNQTSDRILSFAKALTGGDPAKAEEMREAFIKGFEAATKAWGDSLPEISKKTYDAVMEKFDAWAKEGTEA